MEVTGQQNFLVFNGTSPSVEKVAKHFLNNQKSGLCSSTMHE
jgi:hypothetical protein